MQESFIHSYEILHYSTIKCYSAPCKSCTKWLTTKAHFLEVHFILSILYGYTFNVLYFRVVTVFDSCWNLALETEAANDADVIP